MGLAGALIGGASALTGDLTNAKTGLLTGLALGGAGGVMAGEGVSDRVGGAVIGMGFAHALGVIGAHTGTAGALIFGAGMGAAVGVTVSMYHSNKGA